MRELWWLLCSILIGILLITVSWFLQWAFYFLSKPIIVFNNHLVYELNGKYDEPAYNAMFFYKDITNQIKVDNNVNITKVGTYDITYSLITKHYKVIKHQVVTVIDSNPPVITLIGGDKASVCPLATYVEQGYSATDNYDGDITDRVSFEVFADRIDYHVADISGNKTNLTRNIIYEDNQTPTITLKGNKTIYLYVNDKYNESGYNAIDNCDGNINSKVNVRGSVNTSKVGTYTLTYAVSDLVGLNTSVKRTIVVRTRPDNSGKTIYLTFDDGPSNVTSGILNILKDEGVKATFFVINRDDSLNYLITREYNEGHTVALHCYSHNYAVVYASDEAYFNDLAKISNKVKTITGIESKIIRFPGGSSNQVSRSYSIGIMTRLTAEVTKRGYSYYDWNVGSVDTQNIGSTRIYQNVVNGLSHTTNVVLMHDYSSNWQTVNALRSIIQYGKRNGYNFSRITSSTPAIHHTVAN